MKKTISFIIIAFMTCSTFAQNLFIGSFYVTTTDEEKLYGDGGDKWATRRNIICDMFNFEQPDVVGLQSVTEAQISNLTIRMSTYKAAKDILYSKTLELEDSGQVSEMPEGSTCFWAKLKKEGKTFYVFNVCFSTDSSIASASTTRILAAVDEINTETLPYFVVGNLGDNDKKTPYSRLSTRYQDCYKKAPVVSAEYGTVNNFDLEANHSADRFDFVFASKNVTVNAYGQLQYAYYTRESDGSYKRRLPSTHFPVMAKVTLP